MCNVTLLQKEIEKSYTFFLIFKQSSLNIFNIAAATFSDQSQNQKFKFKTKTKPNPNPNPNQNQNQNENQNQNLKLKLNHR